MTPSASRVKQFDGSFLLGFAAGAGALGRAAATRPTGAVLALGAGLALDGAVALGVLVSGGLGAALGGEAPRAGSARSTAVATTGESGASAAPRRSAKNTTPAASATSPTTIHVRSLEPERRLGDELTLMLDTWEGMGSGVCAAADAPSERE